MQATWGWGRSTLRMLLLQLPPPICRHFAQGIWSLLSGFRFASSGFQTRDFQKFVDQSRLTNSVRRACSCNFLLSVFCLFFVVCSRDVIRQGYLSGALPWASHSVPSCVLDPLQGLCTLRTFFTKYLLGIRVRKVVTKATQFWFVCPRTHLAKADISHTTTRYSRKLIGSYLITMLKK